jgi:ATP-dependent RNA circularization protein (DNA/RNA ligase family)
MTKEEMERFKELGEMIFKPNLGVENMGTEGKLKEKVDVSKILTQAEQFMSFLQYLKTLTSGEMQTIYVALDEQISSHKSKIKALESILKILKDFKPTVQDY